MREKIWHILESEKNVRKKSKNNFLEFSLYVRQKKTSFNSSLCFRLATQQLFSFLGGNTGDVHRPADSLLCRQSRKFRKCRQCRKCRETAGGELGRRRPDQAARPGGDGRRRGRARTGRRPRRPKLRRRQEKGGEGGEEGGEGGGEGGGDGGGGGEGQEEEEEKGQGQEGEGGGGGGGG